MTARNMRRHSVGIAPMQRHLAGDRHRGAGNINNVVIWCIIQMATRRCTFM
jgi:hypothetical protein